MKPDTKIFSLYLIITLGYMNLTSDNIQYIFYCIKFEQKHTIEYHIENIN